MTPLLAFTIPCGLGVWVVMVAGYARFVKNSHHDKGFFEAHPHYEGWLEMPALMKDGYVYFRMLVGAVRTGFSVYFQHSKPLDSRH
jgi:hypothetical protein